MTNTQTKMVNAEELATRYIVKKVVLDMELAKLTKQFETADYAERGELQIKAKINRAEREAYHEITRDLIASPRWTIQAYKEIEIRLHEEQGIELPEDK